MTKKRAVALLAACALLCTLTAPAAAAPAAAISAGAFDPVPGAFTVAAEVPAGINAEAVLFPVWSQPDQSDLVWHQAALQDGRWTAQISIREHNWHLGPYVVHCYATAADGSQTLLGETAVMTGLAPRGSLTASHDAFQSTISAVLRGFILPSGAPVSFRVLASDGHEVARVRAVRAGSAYAAQIPVTGIGTDGICTVQACFASGNLVLAETRTELAGTQGSRLYIAAVDGHNGTFEVVSAVRSQSPAQGVLAAVWTDPDQADLRWTAMDRAGDRWVTTVDARDFGNSFGPYIVHVYAQLQNGQLAFVDGTTVDLEPEDYLCTMENEDGTYTVRLLGAPQNAAAPEAEVWSAVYGKDDVRRYSMTPAENGAWTLRLDPADHPGGRTLEVRIWRGEQTIGTALCPEPEAVIGTTSLAAEERLQRNAEAVYAKVGTDLHEVYKYVRDSLSYVSRDGHIVPPDGYTRQQWYAVEGLETFHGNCFTFASSFYELAKRLGYDVQYVEGEVPSVSGNWIPHGFVLLTADGDTYICDAVFEHSSTTGRNYYMQPVERPRTTYRW